MTFTAQEIKTIEDLQKISTVKPFGLWSEPIQNLFKDVGPQNCLVFESLKTWVRPKSHETRFDSRLTYIIKPDFEPEPEPKPECIDLKIEEHNGRLGVYRPDNVKLPFKFNGLFTLPGLPSFVKFISYEEKYIAKWPIEDIAAGIRDGNTIYAQVTTK